MKKMKYAGTKEAVKSALQGIAINLNATDMAEAALSEIEAACKKIQTGALDIAPFCSNSRPVVYHDSLPRGQRHRTRERARASFSLGEERVKPPRRRHLRANTRGYARSVTQGGTGSARLGGLALSKAAGSAHMSIKSYSSVVVVPDHARRPRAEPRDLARDAVRVVERLQRRDAPGV